MPPRDNECPRCRSRLVRGFFPDFDQTNTKEVTWIEGDGVDKRWWGTTVKGQLRYGVEAWRCRECGRLELYALEPQQ